jgi:hypothetical protein
MDITITQEEYDALRGIAKKAYDYASVFYEGYELASPKMQTARRHLMRSLDLDEELVVKFRGY